MGNLLALLVPNCGLKYAVLWRESGKFDGQRVGRTHELTDGDIIELHV